MIGNGSWILTMDTPMGKQSSTLVVLDDGATMTSPEGVAEPVQEFTRDGDTLKWSIAITKPVPMKLHFEVKAGADALEGKFRPGMFPPSPVTGVRA